MSSGASIARCRACLVGPVALAILASATARATCPPGYAKGRPGDTIRVGYAASPPLVVESPDGQPGGPSIDVLRAVAADAGWRLDFVAFTPASLRDRVRACSVDIGVSGLPSSV